MVFFFIRFAAFVGVVFNTPAPQCPSQSAPLVGLLHHLHLSFSPAAVNQPISSVGI